MKIKGYSLVACVATVLTASVSEVCHSAMPVNVRGPGHLRELDQAEINGSGAEREGAKWIWLPDAQSAATNVYAVFRTELPAGADTLRVAVSGTYAAKVDGEVVAFGQYTDFPQDKTYTETRLQPSSRPRTLTVETWFAGNRFSSHYDGEPGLWAEILSSNRVVSASSRAWQVAPMDAYEFGPRTILFVSLNYTWAYDARKAGTPPDWKPARELERPMMSACPRLRPVEPSAIVRTAVGRKIGGGADYALYDFGEEVTGMLSFRLSAPRGREVEIVHGEFLRNGRLPDHAIVGNPGNPRRVVDTFVADGASQYTHWFRRYGLRYLEFRWQGGDVAVEPPEILVTELGGLDTPPFSCSDPLFEKMHEISCRTLRCCLHEKYENCPWREQSICEYDARNQMLFGYPLWGNYDRAAAMLRLFGAAEKDHGYLPAITPSASGTTIPSFTFAWMGAVCDHAWYSGDDTLLREQLPRIRRMLKKILARRKGDLYTIPESLPGAWVWNYCEPGELEFRTNPPNAFYNLYLHEALTDLAKALRRLGDAAGASDYERTAATLAKACEAYWDEERGVYADSFASDGTREVFSGHVQALFLAQGLVPNDRVPRVIAAIREGKVKMPELSALRYLVKGVFDHGTDDDRRWMHGKIREIYGGMIAAGATTWWEATSGADYAESGSLCHGWSALPSWYIAEYILGVRPTSPGYATYEVKPRVPGITASGRVMSPKGPIALPVGASYDFYKPVLVPEPVEAQWQTDVCVRLEKGSAVVRIACPKDEADAVREWFGRHFKSAFGFDCILKMVEGEAKGQENAESYEISADPARGVEIRAQGLVGVRHAFHTLRQIAMRDRVGMTSEKWILPAFRIVDSPKLAFRGFHICWFPEQRVEHIERQIRLAAYYKFNVVVLENWGVYRSEKYPWFGWKDGKMTRAEIRRLVSLAADEGLTLVPQLNIWGHASLSRVRTGNHATLDFAPEYEPLFEPYSGWNWCLSNPAARQVIRELVVELHEAFGNPRYFHIGCDEGCPPTCPKCRAADYNELFSTLVREVVDVLASRGADVLMWHDMLLAKGDSRWGGFYANGDSRAEELLRSLPKSLIVCDWYYGGPQKDYPTVDYFKTQGFRVVTSPSVGCKEGIAAQGKMAVAKGIFGLLQTNWTLYYGNDFSDAFPRSACAAWGTDWRSRPLHQDMTAPVNVHMRQVLRDMGNSDRTLTGFFAEQVPSEPVTPL